MDLLIFALIVLLIAGVICYIVNLLPVDQPFNRIAQAIILLIAVLAIAQRAGLV